ncbi:MAG: TrmH family RNA methyltransferase [Flavobacteriales bacterium]|jgi:TrmH family RNA methyltransferase
MLSKNQLKRIKSLHLKKFRMENRRFIVEGQKSVQEAIKSGLDIELLVKQDGYESSEFEIETFTTSILEMKTLSTLSTAPGILAVVKFPEWYMNEVSALTMQDESVVLVLDGIRDPGNLGTIIRTADWFGLKGIICSPDTVDCFNPKVVQASMGSVFHLPTYYTDLNTFIRKASHTVYGLDLQGENLFSTEISDGIYVLGSESHGLSEGIQPLIQKFLHIPGKGKAESLNAAISAAIVMSQIQ